jgi:hypothetical protein
MMKIIAPSLLMLASVSVFAGSAFAAPAINGQWKVHNSIAGNESDQVCSFTLTDTTLSGSCKTEQGDAKVTGSLKDNKLSWQYNSDYNGSPLTLNYTATLGDTADKIAGIVEVDPFGVSGDFTATPVKADDATKKQ